MNLLTHLPKLLLAASLALGLLPLAAAHACEQGITSVDRNHQIPLVRNLVVCIQAPHVCSGGIEDVLGGPRATPVLP